MTDWESGGVEAQLSTVNPVGVRAVGRMRPPALATRRGLARIRSPQSRLGPSGPTPPGRANPSPAPPPTRK